MIFLLLIRLQTREADCVILIAVLALQVELVRVIMLRQFLVERFFGVSWNVFDSVMENLMQNNCVHVYSDVDLRVPCDVLPGRYA